MTEKELLYVQDALGHEQFSKSQCCQAVNQIKDGELRSFAEQLEKKHGEIFNSFYSLL